MTPRLPAFAALLGLLACGGPAPKAPAGADEPPPADTGPPGEPEPEPDPDCVTDDEQFAAQVAPLLQADCVACHVDGGMAGGTRQVLVPGDDAAATAANHAALAALVRDTPDGAALLLEKPTNTASHGGGQRFDALDPRYAALHELVARLQAPGGCAHPGETPMSCDGTVRPGPAPLRRLTSEQVERTVEHLLEVELPEGLFPVTKRQVGFRTFAQNNTVSAAGAESVMLAAEHAADHADIGALAGCPGAITAACVGDWLDRLGPRALRRPLAPDERALLRRFLDAGVEPEEAGRMALLVLLQSPWFLYLDLGVGEPLAAGTDGGATDGDSTDGAGPVVHHLDDYAVAARLSYLLTDLPPDDALWEAAGRGELRTRAQVSAQAARLVASPEAVGAVVRFHQDWLHLDKLDGLSKDPVLYPDWGPAWIERLRTEADLFSAEVLWMGDARFETLLYDPATWVDPALAATYGLPDPGEGWHRVELGDERPGALSRAGFLAAHAYSATSSPVRRGAWVLEMLLCEELVPPPGVNMNLPTESEEAPTIRERLVQHWTDPSCSSCHLRIDPIGLSMEHFGPLGEWRDAWEDGQPVVATGSLDDPPGDFDGFAEMIALVGASDRAQACYARRWFEYAVGRPADPEDACTLRTLARRFDETGGDIRALLVDLALTDAFLYRAVEEG